MFVSTGLLLATQEVIAHIAFMGLAEQLLDACMEEAATAFSWQYVPVAKEAERASGPDVWPYLVRLFNFNEESVKNQKVIHDDCRCYYSCTC